MPFTKTTVRIFRESQQCVNLSLHAGRARSCALSHPYSRHTVDSLPAWLMMGLVIIQLEPLVNIHLSITH